MILTGSCKGIKVWGNYAWGSGRTRRVNIPAKGLKFGVIMYGAAAGSGVQIFAKGSEAGAVGDYCEKHRRQGLEKGGSKVSKGARRCSRC